MKTKQLFFCSLTGLALLAASCSSNDEALMVVMEPLAKAKPTHRLPFL